MYKKLFLCITILQFLFIINIKVSLTSQTAQIENLSLKHLYWIYYIYYMTLSLFCVDSASGFQLKVFHIFDICQIVKHKSGKNETNKKTLQRIVLFCTTAHFWWSLLHRFMLFFTAVSPSASPEGYNMGLIIHCVFSSAPQRSLTQIWGTKRRTGSALMMSRRPADKTVSGSEHVWAYMSWCLWIMWLLYSSTGGMLSSSSGTWTQHTRVRLFSPSSLKGRERHLVVGTLSYLPVNLIIVAVVIGGVAPDGELQDEACEQKRKD